ncbi:hypothetical protein V5799_014320 [Amblyomma americanum]|uniref:CCHC-type domain-containing protein n=1 Tax=Amblyomma americanum TaxID=6943 RepID=A0AAQ4E3D6_AMBAM
MEVTVEGTDISPEEVSHQYGWFTIGESKRSGHERQRNNPAAHNGTDRAQGQGSMRHSADSSAKKLGRRLARQSVASNLPRLPNGLTKVIFRPLGGLRILESCGQLGIFQLIRDAAGLTLAESSEDCMLLNFKQHTILVATHSAVRVERYLNIKELTYGENKIAITSYVATPDGSGKGVIQGVPKHLSDADILANHQHPRNPPICGVRRMGAQSQTVLILFNGERVPRWISFGGGMIRCCLYKKKYEVCSLCGQLGHRRDVCPDPKNARCRGCGVANPPETHSCEPECALCANAAGNRNANI